MIEVRFLGPLKDKEALKIDIKNLGELKELLSTYVGRPSPLYHAKRLSEHFGHDIYLFT